MDCSTIIVSYNTFALTREAVDSALASGGALDHEVIIVDNDSPDGSAARLREAFADDPRVRVEPSGGNIGFSAANNLGAAVARGEVLFFLNPDTVVHGPAIPDLVRYLRAHPEAGAVGPRVLNTDGSDQTCTAEAPSYGAVFRHYFLPHLGPARARRVRGAATAVDIVKGCSLAVRREAFDAAGGWDERTFMYAEENELCLALQERGFINVFLPASVITHHGGAASPDRYIEQQVLAVRNTIAFFRRRGPRGLVAFDRAAALLAFGLRSVAFRILAAASPARRTHYLLRAQAASALLRWYALDHA